MQAYTFFIIFVPKHRLWILYILTECTQGYVLSIQKMKEKKIDVKSFYIPSSEGFAESVVYKTYFFDPIVINILNISCIKITTAFNGT